MTRKVTLNLSNAEAELLVEMVTKRCTLLSNDAPTRPAMVNIKTKLEKLLEIKEIRKMAVVH